MIRFIESIIYPKSVPSIRISSHQSTRPSRPITVDLNQASWFVNSAPACRASASTTFGSRRCCTASVVVRDHLLRCILSQNMGAGNRIEFQPGGVPPHSTGQLPRFHLGLREKPKPQPSLQKQPPIVIEISYSQTCQSSVAVSVSLPDSGTRRMA